jgi:hypothetical protein
LKHTKCWCLCTDFAKDPFFKHMTPCCVSTIFLGCLMLMMKTVLSFKMLEITHLVTQHCIPNTWIFSHETYLLTAHDVFWYILISGWKCRLGAIFARNLYKS